MDTSNNDFNMNCSICFEDKKQERIHTLQCCGGNKTICYDCLNCLRIPTCPYCRKELSLSLFSSNNSLLNYNEYVNTFNSLPELDLFYLQSEEIQVSIRNRTQPIPISFRQHNHNQLQPFQILFNSELIDTREPEFRDPRNLRRAMRRVRNKIHKEQLLQRRRERSLSACDVQTMLKKEVRHHVRKQRRNKCRKIEKDIDLMFDMDYI